MERDWKTTYGIIGTNGKVHDEVIQALKTLDIGQPTD